MKGKRENIIKKELDDFMRYRRNEMPHSERNAFEKNLQKDPFSEEAAEGFSTFEPGEISGDLASLHKKLTRRTRRIRRMTWYRIAASVAVLMIISSIYIVLDRSGSGNLYQRNIIPDTVDIPGSEAIREELPAAKAPELHKARKDQGMPSDKSSAGGKAAEEPYGDEQKVADVSEDNIESQPVKEEAENQTAPAAAEKSDSFIMMAEQEKKAAYGSKRLVARSLPARLSSDFYGAVPVTGKDSFDIYIQKNIRMPRQQAENQDSAVILSFIVTKAGIPAEIEILSTPGEEYSEEAIRLLKEGPLWKPATRNGAYAMDKATIEIPFRRSD